MSLHHCSSRWRPPFKVLPLPGLPYDIIPSPCPRSANGFQLILVSRCLNIPAWLLSPVSPSARVPYSKVCLSASVLVRVASWQHLTDSR